MVKRPSLKKFFRIDYRAMLGLVFVVATVILLPCVSLTESTSLKDGLLFAAIIAPLLIIAPAGLAAWRVWAIYAIFAEGVEAPAQIKRVALLRGKGAIDYRYAFQGRTYSRRDYVVDVKETRALQPGAKVTAIVNHRKPDRACIRDLYV